MSDDVLIWDALTMIGLGDQSMGNHETQVRCPFHKAGREESPSARVYPATNSFYCFTCHQSWDGIGALARHWDISRREVAKRLDIAMPAKRGRLRSLDEQIAELLLAIGNLPEAERMAAWQLVDKHVLGPAARGDSANEVVAAMQDVARELFGRLAY